MVECLRAADRAVIILLMKGGELRWHFEHQMLASLDYHVLKAERTPDGEFLFPEEQPDLIILDIGQPDEEGFELCQRIQATAKAPFIILSERATSANYVRGLRLGADDYLTRPYDPFELSARIEAILRRRRMTKSAIVRPLLECGSLAIDVSQKLVTINDIEVSLTPTEYRLLVYLAQNANRTLTVDAVTSEVWGSINGTEAASLHLLISRLRRKLQDSAKTPRFIVTLPGIGYMLRRNAA